MIRPSVSFLGAALAVAIAVAPSVDADTIVRVSGKPLTDVQIKVARWDQVSFEKDGRTQTLSGDQIASIQRASSLISRVRKALDAGQYKEASDAQKRGVEGSTGWQKIELEYLGGLIYLRAGGDKNWRKAEAAFKAFVDAHKDAKDFWVPHALHGRAQASLGLGRGGTAGQLFKQLETYGATWTLRATLGQAKAALLDKNWNKARQAFNKVASDRRAPESIQLEAKVGRIEVLVRQEQYDPAIRDLDKEFFANPAPSELAYTAARARATLMMGLAYKKKGGKEDIERAEIWLLRTAVLYAAHPTTYKQACSELAEVYEALGRNDRAQQWKRRGG